LTPSPDAVGQELVRAEVIERRILLIRGHKVMLDSHLAELYEVPTFRLNEAVKRNRRRFPEDFMFQLGKEEAECLTSQFAMSKLGRGGRRTLPYVFTEQGVAMLSTVLNSERAIAVNIGIMRAFMRLRQILATHKDLAQRFCPVSQAANGRNTGGHRCANYAQTISILYIIEIYEAAPDPVRRTDARCAEPRSSP
jgi:hypothetical protein